MRTAMLSAANNTPSARVASRTTMRLCVAPRPFLTQRCFSSDDKNVDNDERDGDEKAQRLIHEYIQKEPDFLQWFVQVSDHVFVCGHITDHTSLFYFS